MDNLIDFKTPHGQRVLNQLQNEQVIWLTTVGPNQSPQPRPVWFLWDGESCLIYSQPKAYKLKHIEDNSKVSLNFNSDFDGEEVSIMLGIAKLHPNIPLATKNDVYLKKYRKGIAGIDMTPEEFAIAYSVPLVVTLSKLRGF